VSDVLEGNEEPLTANGNVEFGPMKPNIERFEEYRWAYDIALQVFGIGNVTLEEFDCGGTVGVGFQVIRDGKRGRRAIKLRWLAEDPEDPERLVSFDWNHPKAPYDRDERLRDALLLAHAKCLEDMRDE
jgi:hypothetical protein